MKSTVFLVVKCSVVCALLLFVFSFFVNDPIHAYSRLEKGYASIKYDFAAKEILPDSADSVDWADSQNFYDQTISYDSNGNLWSAWLEFCVDSDGNKYDKLWVVMGRSKLLVDSGVLFNPNLVHTSGGICYLSYQTVKSGISVLNIRKLEANDVIAMSDVIDFDSEYSFANHSVFPDNDGGIWVAGQVTVAKGLLAGTSSNAGTGIIVFYIDNQGNMRKKPVNISGKIGNHRNPDICVDNNGSVCVVWTVYDGTDFHVLASNWSGIDISDEILDVKSGINSQFLGNAKVTNMSSGGFYICWEEGGENWGKKYLAVAVEPGKDWDNSRYMNITDDHGPLHRFSSLRSVRLVDSIIYPNDIEIPQPSFELKWLSDEVKGLQRTGVEKLGVYYERPELLTDSLGRIWVFYRHYRNEYCRRTDFHDEKIIGHYELGWKIFGRYFDGKQWSQLYLFGQSDGGSAKTMYNQRDGQQRLSVARGADGKIGLLWTVGRTDRDMKQNSDSSTYPGEQYRGLCSVEYAEAVGQFYDTNRVNDPSDKGVMKIFDPSCILADKSRESCMVDGMEYQLFLGEMHRHTDISRCQSFYDGNMSDVYVYARDVVDLDFVATTDHELDYACADINSQVWWRYYKNTINNAVPDTFFILIGFERSAVGHHYNVISLEGVETKMPMPSRDYARYVQDDINLNGSKRALLIPHESDDGCFVGSEDDSRMDSARRLLEVYQGCRADKTGKAELIVAALQNNNNLRHFGIVASSDHHSTFASFTGVWVSEDSSDTDVISRDDIFTALFDRRTFAATDKTALIFKAGNVWMGNEIVDCDQIPQFQVRIKPSVDITGLVNPIIEVYTDKNIQNNTTVSEPVMRSTDFVVENGWLCLDIVLSEEDFSKLQDHWIFVTYSEGLLDEAGGKNSRAWSSPIWFKLKQ